MPKISYQDITNRILEQMQTHGSDWVKPFESRNGAAIPQNAFTLKPYRGINVLLLGFCGGYWATYKQWAERGYQVAKGQRGTQIIFFKKWVKEHDDGSKSTIPLLKSFTVFEADQLDPSVKPYEAPTQKVHVDETDIIEAADEWLEMSGADITYIDQGRAFYQRSTDKICLPHRDLFSATETSSATAAFYSTAFHELTHWAGAPSRCDRVKGKAFGDPAYAFEELVAELGAAFQCALLGVSVEPRADHAHYLNNWMQCLKDEPKAIFRAATLAQQSVDYIASLQGVEVAA